jgi:hypothetical protein
MCFLLLVSLLLVPTTFDVPLTLHVFPWYVGFTELPKQ